MRKIVILCLIPFIISSCAQHKENKEKKRLVEIRITEINRFAEEIKAMVLSENPPKNISISHGNSMSGVLFYGHTNSDYHNSLLKIPITSLGYNNNYRDVNFPKSKKSSSID